MVEEILLAQFNALHPQEAVRDAQVEHDVRHGVVEHVVLHAGVDRVVGADLEADGLLVEAVDLLARDRLEQVDGLLDARGELVEGGLVVLPHLELTARQALDVLLGKVGHDDDLEREGQHVVDEAGRRQGLSLRVLLGLLQKVEEGLERVVAHSDGGIVEREGGHCEVGLGLERLGTGVLVLFALSCWSCLGWKDVDEVGLVSGHLNGRGRWILMCGHLQQEGTWKQLRLSGQSSTHLCKKCPAQPTIGPGST